MDGCSVAAGQKHHVECELYDDSTEDQNPPPRPNSPFNLKQSWATTAGGRSKRHKRVKEGEILRTEIRASDSWTSQVRMDEILKEIFWQLRANNNQDRKISQQIISERLQRKPRLRQKEAKTLLKNKNRLEKKSVWVWEDVISTQKPKIRETNGATKTDWSWFFSLPLFSL